MNIMLCGANDTASVLPFFNEVSREMGFQAYNFIDGKIKYHNHGTDKWVTNAKLTLHNADALIFIITLKYGEITWETEFKEALYNGKNFIVLCDSEIYRLYRQLIGNKLKIPRSSKGKNLKLVSRLMQRLELEEQITIVTYSLPEIKDIFKKQLIALFEYGMELGEKENKRNSFKPVLLSSRFNDIPKKYITPRNDELCREILYDQLEKKELRKRAMDYFMVSKILSEEDIIGLCLDPEQGVSRKAIQNINSLISPGSDLTKLFSEIIPSVANEEVGVIRRSIASFMQLDLAMSIQYFHLFFPSTDVGTPRRIILGFAERMPELRRLLKGKPKLIDTLIQLINQCLNYKSDGGGWKDQADLLLKEFGKKQRKK